MKYLIALMVGVAALFAGAAHGEGAPPKVSEEDKVVQPLFDSAVPLVRSRRYAEAVAVLDQVIGIYEQRYNADKTRYFCARTKEETLLYLFEAAAAKDGNSAVVVSMNWASAHYIKAYSLIELGRLQEAKASLQKAVQLSPQNSRFLSELAHVYQSEKDWSQALKTFELAAAAKDFSPPDQKDADLARAWRGMGFAYVELDRLDDAEKTYLKCLELNKNDSAAANELQYVRAQKGKRPAAISGAAGVAVPQTAAR
ncbi:tetratricopeptide repeat protein [Roseateles saccharophilus]|uniref:Tetratricopeptide repeat protein n=1 Tax=Roseateles saccharophilus TaxID=304 RepID=A0A4R3UYI0_ROSSA|nr:tetratricopeptide repeat protein [Roseateles saccharophilus]MDG0835281.1 tetratricopeptide repeat protein [Roseateles saccharophilus]TCU96190.1 tetratricopeptide repeat protein [Roseateles saccharophilus]